MAGAARANGEPGGKVPANEVEGGADNEHRDLGDQLRGDEGEPVVGLGFLFACFEQVAIADEERLQLADAARRHEDEVEDGHEPQLQVKYAAPDHPKCEAPEQRVGNVQSHLIPYIFRVAPESQQLPLRHQSHLVPERRRKILGLGFRDLSVLGGGTIRNLRFFETVELCHHARLLDRAVPDQRPVDLGAESALHDVNNVFGRVYILWRRSAVPSKVVQHHGRVLARRSKVCGPAALGEQ